MASYEAHAAGVEHDLVLLFKGFDGRPATASYRERAASHQTVEVTDTGSDVTAYKGAARQLTCDHVCFLNSFSEIAAPNWLAHLEAALRQPGVGAAGATGSWGSHLSFNMFQAGLGGAYTKAFTGRRAARRAMHALTGTPVRGAPAEMAYAAVQALRDAAAMPRFPSAHLRTNAFLIERERFASLRLGPAGDKRAAYRFESGRAGLTAQLRASGDRVVVVDRDGVVHPTEAWDRSGVFWQAEQEQLMVHDNQTRSYAAAHPDVRRVLSAFAWGARAEPGGTNATH